MTVERNTARIALGAGLAALVITALVTAGLTTAIDGALLNAMKGLVRNAMTRETLRDITALGSFAVLGIAVLGAVGYLVAGERWRRGVMLLASALGATLASTLLKIGIDRSRPQGGDLVPQTFTASFPSGHAFLSAAVLLTIGGMLARAARHPGERRVVLAFSIALTIAIGTSRVLLGVHWPSDVLAGWCFGAMWAAATLALTPSGASQEMPVDR